MIIADLVLLSTSPSTPQAAGLKIYLLIASLCVCGEGVLAF